MAEPFGNSFTVVEVASDDAKTEIWIALAKPSQAPTLVLAAVPEGWTAAVLDVPITAEQQGMFEELRAGPGCLDSAPLDLSGFLPGYAERGALRFCRCVGRA
ncbi:hypothetical protein ABIF72_004527 [Bradyrhizobium japonicum]